MTDHTTTAFHHLAQYVGQSDVALGLWICAFFMVLAFIGGFGCVQMTAGTPPPEGMPPSELLPEADWLVKVIITIVSVVSIYFIFSRGW